MSGIIRNILMLVPALCAARVAATSRTVCHVRVTPFDSGLRVLKSDKYLQLAEAAQLDYLAKTALLHTLLRRRVQFVNASQLIKFSRPIAMFSRVRIETELVFADDKCAYFSHSFFVGERKHSEVLVKMKFKAGPLTVRPSDLIGCRFTAKPAPLEQWDQALASL